MFALIPAKSSQNSPGEEQLISLQLSGSGELFKEATAPLLLTSVSTLFSVSFIFWSRIASWENNIKLNITFKLTDSTQESGYTQWQGTNIVQLLHNVSPSMWQFALRDSVNTTILSSMIAIWSSNKSRISLSSFDLHKQLSIASNKPRLKLQTYCLYHLNTWWQQWNNEPVRRNRLKSWMILR